MATSRRPGTDRILNEQRTSPMGAPNYYGGVEQPSPIAQLKAATPHTSLGGPSADQHMQFGAFGPENAVQGPFGRDMSVTNPIWARWFDMLHAAAPAGVSGMGSTPPHLNPSVQPGPGNLSTSGYAPGELPGPPPGTVANAPISPLNNDVDATGGQNILGHLSNPLLALQTLKARQGR